MHIEKRIPPWSDRSDRERRGVADRSAEMRIKTSEAPMVGPSDGAPVLTLGTDDVRDLRAAQGSGACASR